MNRNGQTVRVTPAEYRQRLVEELLATVPTLAGFRARWLDPEQRRELLEQLRAPIKSVAGKSPQRRSDGGLRFVQRDRGRRLRRKAPHPRRTRRPPGHQRARLVRSNCRRPPRKVIRAIARQFATHGTNALETDQLWSAGEVKADQGLTALKLGGEPNTLLRKTKETLFAQ